MLRMSPGDLGKETCKQTGSVICVLSHQAWCPVLVMGALQPQGFCSHVTAIQEQAGMQKFGSPSALQSPAPGLLANSSACRRPRSSCLISRVELMLYEGEGRKTKKAGSWVVRWALSYRRIGITASLSLCEYWFIGKGIFPACGKQKLGFSSVCLQPAWQRSGLCCPYISSQGKTQQLNSIFNYYLYYFYHEMDLNFIILWLKISTETSRWSMHCDRDISFANRKEEQAACVLPVLAEKQDFTQWPWGGEEAGLDHSWGPGGMHPLQSRWVEINVWRDVVLFSSLRSDLTIGYLKVWVDHSHK